MCNNVISEPPPSPLVQRICRRTNGDGRACRLMQNASPPVTIGAIDLQAHQWFAIYLQSARQEKMENSFVFCHMVGDIDTDRKLKFLVFKQYQNYANLLRINPFPERFKNLPKNRKITKMRGSNIFSEIENIFKNISLKIL